MGYYGNIPATGDDNNFKILDDISSFTGTFDGSSTEVSVANDTIQFNGHRFVTGQRVKYTNGGGGDIGGLTNNGFFFIIKNDNNTIKLATTAARAASGTAINITSLGTGSSHTLNVAFDGVNTKFKATYGGGSKSKITRGSQLVISVNGVIQQPSNSSSPSNGFGIASNGVIVFSQAPAATDAFWGHILTNNNVTFDISDNDIDTFTGNNSTTEFNLSKQPVNNQNLLVTLDGVIQYPSDSTTTRAYTVIGSVLQFVGAPGTGVEIQARHIGFAGATTSEVTGFYGRTGNVSLTSSDDITIRNITGQHLNLTGVSTIAGAIDANGDIDVDGQTTLDDLNVAGVSTLGGAVDINSNVDVSGFIDVDGQATLDDLNVSGVSTFAALINANADAGVKVGTAITIASGVITATKAHIGAVGAASTWPQDLVVVGDARVTGILTVGEDSVVINGTDVNISGVATASNFKTGTTNVHNVGIELAGINVLGADTPIGTGATIYNTGGANFTGVVTATTFVGNLTGTNLTGTLQTAAQPNITSLGTLSSLSVSGAASIGGALQYEDVVNVDSVGLITARNGINVSGGSITAGAASFSGDVSIADKIIHTGDTNTAIRFPTLDHVTVETGGTERLRIGSTGISTFTNDVRIVKSAGPLLELTTNTGSADATLRLSEGATGSTSNGGGMFYSGANNKLHITCGTDSTTQRITIDRDTGKTTFANDVQIDGDELFITDAIKHVGDTDTSISFPSNDTIRCITAGSERLEITNSGVDVTGNITVSGTVDGRDLQTDGTKLDGIAASANNFVHPTHPGDDFSVDTGALTGATVVSDIDINITTDTLGHVTDANATVSTRTLDGLVPVGTVIWFAGTSAPTGYAICNGAAVSRSTFSALFAVVGTTYGAGDGSSTFNLPELRSEFVRGFDDGRVSTRAVGSTEAAANGEHNHNATQGNHAHDASQAQHNHNATQGNHSHDSSATQGSHTHTADQGTHTHQADQGQHSHDASSDSVTHNHNANTNNTGNHSHTYNSRQSNQNVDNDEGHTASNTNNSTQNTGNTGAHSHNVSVGNNSHSHTITVDSEGAGSIDVDSSSAGTIDVDSSSAGGITVTVDSESAGGITVGNSTPSVTVDSESAGAISISDATPGISVSDATPGVTVDSESAGSITVANQGDAAGARPRNVALLPCIKTT